jgi:hypothetical protein
MIEQVVTPLKTTQHSELLDIFQAISIPITSSLSVTQSIQSQKPLAPTTQQIKERTLHTTSAQTELIIHVGIH